MADTTTLGAAIAAATNKPTPVSGDLFAFADSESSNATAFCSLSDLVAAICPQLALTSNTVTLNSTYYNTRIYWSPTGTATMTLPANGAPAGKFITVYLLTNQTATISAATADTLIAPNDTQADSVAFSTSNQKIGSCVHFESNGTYWIATNRSSNTMTVAT